MEYAPNYFDLSTFPDGETKRALLRVQKKRSLKAVDGGGSGSVSNGRNSPAPKRAKKA